MKLLQEAGKKNISSHVFLSAHNLQKKKIVLFFSCISFTFVIEIQSDRV